jgi:oligopeptide/dipeptide ABC transporter ATP-binding protein
MSGPDFALTVNDLSVGFDHRDGHFNVIDGANLSLTCGRTLALVGESGCGKSLLTLALMGLIERPGRVTGGTLAFAGTSYNLGVQASLAPLRGVRAGMVFQEPMSALNPVFTVGAQIAENLDEHGLAQADGLRDLAVNWLRRVGLPDPQRAYAMYPHQLSGGMKQRVMIAMALAAEPQVLFADEPTTALDATVQGQILRLLRTLQRERNLAMLLVTHDLGLVRQYADEVAIMYAGQIVEVASVAALLSAPRHPYTQALLACRPGAGEPGAKLPTIAGAVPRPQNFVAGCRFAPRCAERLARCQHERPRWQAVAHQHGAACWLHDSTV